MTAHPSPILCQKTDMKNDEKSINIAIAWCLAWGDQREPQFDLLVLQQMRKALKSGGEVPEVVRSLVNQVEQLQAIRPDWFPASMKELSEQYADLWKQNTRIGLVYGGATKIKQYVFEAAKLQDIRGASAILDRINLVDLPAFFKKPKKNLSISRWLANHFPDLEAALIPELIIYSTGGNILAFCPAAFVDDLANAIEKRYTEETLTANSCAVGDTFRLLEIRFGLLHESLEKTKWLDWYLEQKTHPLVDAYFGKPDLETDWKKLFENRKSFNELAGKLAALFNKRRNGNALNNSQRPSRCYPPMFETHPYLVRDESDRRSAVIQADLPKKPWFSEALARKRIVGQQTKGEDSQNQQWYQLNWQSESVDGWVKKFKLFLNKTNQDQTYYQNLPSDVQCNNVRESQRMQDIAKSRPIPSISGFTEGFVAYIYADGNNMGGYIQKIRTPQEYKQFSIDIFQATTESVYTAIAKHLHPRKIENITDTESQTKLFPWVHPFEIIAIGGDDVMLIVPADKALEIAQTIGEEFERQLAKLKAYQFQPDFEVAEVVLSAFSLLIESKLHLIALLLIENYQSGQCHRYQYEQADISRSKLSMSIGVLITSDTTPIYYAQELTEQLLKSAKSRAKELKAKYQYYGGTIDFLVMKSVTMISSNVKAFREQGLTETGKNGQKLKLYGAPYTLHEIKGILNTAKALKKAKFPRSQLYQIRGLLKQGKNTAILNYRYFRVRLKDQEAQKLLKEQFEESWCSAKTNDGNIAPWMFDKKKRTYETIWRELVDLYPFIEASEDEVSTQELTTVEET